MVFHRLFSAWLAACTCQMYVCPCCLGFSVKLVFAVRFLMVFQFDFFDVLLL